MKILACTHVPQEGLGYLEELLPQLGVTYEYQELYQDPHPRPLAGYQGLIVMGGSMNVDQVQEYPFLRTDYHYIEEALKLGMPILGFCLGAQLLAKVLGAKVYRNSQPELGWYDLNLVAAVDHKIFEGFPQRCKVFQSHGDTFDLPQGAQLLASTTGCKHQAFSWQEKAIGLQFHLEVTADMIKEWLQDTGTVKEWGFKPELVTVATAQNIQAATGLCSQLGRNFVKIMRESDQD
jgi:GMP synthase (glutamine-hydrolysing)